MKSAKEMEGLINSTLNSLEGIQRAEPGAHFYTRLMGRMQGEMEGPWEKLVGFISKPAIAFGILAFVLLGNGFAVADKLSGSKATSELTDYSLIEDYAMQNTAIYENENPEP